MDNKPSTSKEIIAFLATKFPACFSVEGQAVPLKVGVFQEIAAQLTEEDGVSKTRLRQALRHYTSSWRYLKSIKVGVQRLDLTGEKVADITQDEADYAAKTLLESQEKFGKKAKKPVSKVDATKGDKKEATSKRKTFKNVKSTKQVSKPKPVKVELKPIEESAIKAGNNIKVKLGNSPMDAVITEVEGNDVFVQLASGMVIKTQVENIFS